MKIAHIALWTNQLEALKDFYIEHFSAEANQKYERPDGSFASYFLTFPEGGQLEIMQAPDVALRPYGRHEKVVGLTHLAIAVLTRGDVDELFQILQQAGCSVEKTPARPGMDTTSAPSLTRMATSSRLLLMINL